MSEYGGFEGALEPLNIAHQWAPSNQTQTFWYWNFTKGGRLSLPAELATLFIHLIKDMEEHSFVQSTVVTTALATDGMWALPGGYSSSDSQGDVQGIVLAGVETEICIGGHNLYLVYVLPSSLYTYCHWFSSNWWFYWSRPVHCYRENCIN